MGFYYNKINVKPQTYKFNEDGEVVETVEVDAKIYKMTPAKVEKQVKDGDKHYDDSYVLECASSDLKFKQLMGHKVD